MTPDPAWIDDPTASISLAKLNASLAHHAATRRAEAGAVKPAGAAPPARRREHQPAADQASFLAPLGDRER